MSERLLTARELADRLGVSAETVLRWTRRGELPAIKLPGGAIRYHPDDLADWLAEHATAAPAREAPATQTGTADRRLSSLAPATSPVRRATTEEDL
jgi:excisionase family DNA binding protein